MSCYAYVTGQQIFDFHGEKKKLNTGTFLFNLSSFWLFQIV